MKFMTLSNAALKSTARSCPAPRSRCVGVQMQFSSRSSAWPCRMGSVSNTSTAAMPGRPRFERAEPARRPSISSAREVLTSTRGGLHAPQVVQPSRCLCVPSLRRRCSDSTSASFQKNSLARVGARGSRRLQGALPWPRALPHTMHLHAERAPVAGHDLADAARSPRCPARAPAQHRARGRSWVASTPPSAPTAARRRA
jgi:hypothetical protein